MTEAVSWVLVHDDRLDGAAVGALGYVNFHDDLTRELAAVVAFHQAKDFNRDGSVSLGERAQAIAPIIGNEHQVMMGVLRAAQEDPDIYVLGGGLRRIWGQTLMSMGFSMIADAVYLVYFQQPISTIGGAVAQSITANKVKQMAIKQGFARLFKKGYDSVTP